MVIGLFSGFNGAVRAMQTAQHALGVHTSNIANANDPKYTRRGLVSPSEAAVRGPGVTRLRDAFVDNQYRNASGMLGESEVRRQVMTKVEDVFGDPVAGGLRQAIDQFFDSWQGLSENPSDGVARLQVLSAGRGFAHQIQSVYSQLTAVEQTVNEQMAAKVEEVNSNLREVFDLNIKISNLNRNNMDDSTLRDERDAVLDNLAKLTGSTAMEQADGTVRVIVGPTPVVDGSTLVKLKIVQTAGGPKPGWEAYNEPIYAGKGMISGLLNVRDTELNQLKSDVDNLGRAVATAVNTLHQAGVGLNGETGLNFFLIGAGPADIVVDPALQPSRIAASSGSGQASDGQQARELAKLSESPILESVIIPGQFQAARTFYRNVVGWIGAQAQDAAQLEGIARTHVRMGEQQRMSQWGVSMDEEVANLSVQQKAFAAAARVISTMDEMLDTLINRT